jgi:hypothetical protein
MAKKPAVSRSRPKAEPSPNQYKVERDSTYVRLAPDNVLVVDRDEDLELNLLVHERRPISLKQAADTPFGTAGGDFKMLMQLVEIANVRIPRDIALNMALTIIDANMENMSIDIPKFRSIIDDIINSHTKDETDD